MEDIRFYDFDFNLLHIEHDIFSCNWSFYENNIGNFEMHFPLENPLTDVVMNHRYLVAVQGEKQAVITGRQLEKDAVLYGRSLNFLLTRFCIPEGVDTKKLVEEKTLDSCNAQSVCRYVIQKAFGELVIFVDSEETDFGTVSFEEDGVVSVFDVVQHVMAQADGGHKLMFDPVHKCWSFCITKGKSLPISFSEANRNAHDMTYAEDLQNFYAGGWYCQKMENLGDWNCAGNNPELKNKKPENYAKCYRVSKAGSMFGFNFDVDDYIVCKNKEGIWEKSDNGDDFLVHIPSGLSGIYAWEGLLHGETEKEAQESLAEKRISQLLTAHLSQMSFGKDYALGDLVCVALVKGTFRKKLKRKISGVRLWYEENDVGEEPIMEEAAE